MRLEWKVYLMEKTRSGNLSLEINRFILLCFHTILVIICNQAFVIPIHKKIYVVVYLEDPVLIAISHEFAMMSVLVFVLCDLQDSDT